MVGEGAGALAAAVRRGWSGGARWRCRDGVASLKAIATQSTRRGGSERNLRPAPGSGRISMWRRIGATAGRCIGWRSEAGAISSAGERGRGAHRPRSCLAHGDACTNLRATICCWRRRTSVVDLADPASWSRHGMVGGIDGARRRRHGGEAARFHRAGTEGAGAAGDQVPRPRVSANYLRPRIYAAGESEPVAESQRGGQEVAGASRVCAGRLKRLERFVRREPLRRVHECVFGVLALESEPVDPRL